ncbi:MAG: transposase [Thermofilum sp.]|nr:transposase [Thermofilum sp.]
MESGPGTPRGEDESVTRKSSRTGIDPGARGGAPGLRPRSAKRAKKKIDGEGIIIEPLNAWARLLVGQCGEPRGSGVSEARAVRVWRCDVVRLLPTPRQEELLCLVGDQTARLINMENFRRRQLFFSAGKIDYSWRSAWGRRKTEYTEVYRVLGSVNFHEACRLIGEEWRSFVELLKAEREGRLPPWQRVRPPGYRKREGQRTPIVVVRFDNYRVDMEGKVLHLGYWNASIPFRGKPRWLIKPGAKQGRLVITYDPVRKRWYAHVSVEVLLERKRCGGSFMGIDLGREVLVAAVASDGTALLYKGGVLKSDYFYFERRIAVVDRALSDAGMRDARRSALQEERRRLFEKRERRRDQAFANTASHLKRFACVRNVGIVFIGYPWYISQEKPGKGNTNMWGQRKLLLRLATTLENAGIPAFAVSEDGTSRKCAYHNVEVQRKPRGLVHCPHGHTLHADINGGLNIMLRGLEALGIEVQLPERIRVLSFLATPSGVKPIKP